MPRALPNRRRAKRKSILPFLIISALILCIIKLPDFSREYIFPKHYSEYINKYSVLYNMDENLIYAVIKTESNFDPDAESDVGARGLMQLMEDAYEWVNYRMEDTREIDYSYMYEPEYNIEYGTYLLMLLYEEYGDTETALAAYHTGRGNVNKWLKDESLSSDGKTIDTIPSSATNHYVNKVMRAYDAYNNLY